MSSTYSNDNNLIPVKGFIDFDENGEVILVPTMPTPRVLTTLLNNNNNKRKAYEKQDFYYNEPEKYECNICHKKFVKKSYWKRHELSHNEKFKCKICGTEFMHNTHLTQHMRVHREREYACDICGMKIRFKFNIKKHRATHIPYRDEEGNIKYLC
jgi:uncharacterized Zn-finger protein